MKSIIAIDPGALGGIAMTMPCTLSPAAYPMPETEADVVSTIHEHLTACKLEQTECVAYVEKVGGFCGKGLPGSAMFNFGFGAGVIEGALRALAIRTVYVRPQEWQKTFSLGTAASCASKTEWKNKLKAEAQRRFPSVKVTLKTSDALLILEHAKGCEI